MRRSSDPSLFLASEGRRHAEARRRLVANLEAAPSQLHPFADALGVRVPDDGDGARLLFMESPLLTRAEQDSSILALNVAIDIAAGRAARARVAGIGRIATTSLTTVRHRAPDGAGLWVSSHVEHIGHPGVDGARQIVCSGRVDDGSGQVAGGTMIATALDATRLGGARPSARAGTPGPALLADLDRLIAEAAGISLTRSLLLGGTRLDPAPHGEVHITIRPLLENLVQHLQGGAVPSVADLLARDLIGRPELRPQASHWTFRGPLQRDARFSLDVVSGAASAHAAIRVSEGGRLRGLGTISYRPEDLR